MNTCQSCGAASVTRFCPDCDFLDPFDPNDDPIEGGDDDQDFDTDKDQDRSACASCGDSIPALGIAVCEDCRSQGYCPICGAHHYGWQCPKVVQARLEMERAERLMHTEMVKAAALAIRERYEANPIWREAA